VAAAPLLPLLQLQGMLMLARFPFHCTTAWFPPARLDSFLSLHSLSAIDMHF
jgi:hypothetical protein